MEQKTTVTPRAVTPQADAPRLYANAIDVLPGELLAAVQRHFGAGILYIPPADPRYYDDRRKLVLALRLQGVPTIEIARMTCVSTRRVRQILAQARKKSKK